MFFNKAVNAMEYDAALLLSKLESVQEQKLPMSPWLYKSSWKEEW